MPVASVAGEPEKLNINRRKAKQGERQMKKTITKNEFRDAFHTMNREANFSYEGLGALYDYLEEYEESGGVEVELDVIAICCEFSEYEDLKEIQGNYDIDSIEQLQDYTTVIEFTDGIIIQDY